MSEQLLKAIILLFAILAKIDGLSKDERITIRNFLYSRLNDATASYYFSLFNQLITQYEKRESRISQEEKIREEKRELEKISRQINNELTQHQKIVLIMDIIALSMADGRITKGEEEIIYSICKAIRIKREDIDAVKSFAMAQGIQDFDNDMFLVIASDRNGISRKTRFIENPNIEGFIACLGLDNYSGTYFLKYLGSSHIYLNNIPVKNNEMRIMPSGSTIRGPNIRTLFYSDIASGFKKHKKGSMISFFAENINYKFKSGDIGLRDIFLKEQSGTLVGIMGSSGSGKSTLMNILNGNEKPGSGTVEINGVDIHRDRKKIEGIIGYVPQYDLLIEDLTVFQNLFYAAKLCFSNLNDQEITSLVNSTLINLGLMEFKHLKVGNPMEKIISGGQRKRLNIGLELLREPSVMFVDEPTSGLSSRDSENIMDLLKELTLKGKLIFVVIHQPSSDIFKLFDKLIILDLGGYQIYYGNPIQAVTYFKNEFNLVDSEQGECTTCGNVNPEQIFNIIETKVVNEFGRLTVQRKVTPLQWHETFQRKIMINEVPEHRDPLSTTLSIPGRIRQLGIFTVRDFLSKISNKQYLLINLLEAPILAIILAFIVRFSPASGSGSPAQYFFSTNVNMPAYIFMSIIVALFMGLTVSAEEIFRDRKILRRESFLNLSRSSYLVSKMLILFSLSAVQTFTYTLIGNSILEIQGMFVPFWLILFSTSCFANLLGLNISSAFNSAVTIYILIPILLIPQILLSGVVVKFDELNPRMTAMDKVPLVGEIMASRWAFEAAMVTQYKENRFEKPFFDLDKQMGNSEFKNLYYIPTLMSKLDYCHLHYRDNDPQSTNQVIQYLLLLKNEIGLELEKFGSHNLRDFENLELTRFTGETYENTKRFLEVLKKVYIRRYNDAMKEKERLMSLMTDSPEKRQIFELIKKENFNERIGDMVTNRKEALRIVEHGDDLIQKIYPVYYEEEHPDHLLDFRTIFYASTKHFLGSSYDTLWFNIIMIWVMTFFLIITLYFDVLRWVIQLPEFLRIKKESISHE
ncbi:MAG: ATP-binding cassette domain-containing protein [Cyclobacteriaceae bacterium]|nr:ATP-binding cassette domain-containing protein [Cyclobacteriaceae bacterium]